MEPVRVVCQNCHGKLVVRLESLLGQIVICPRCRSNVQIPAASPGPLIASPTSYDSSAITRVDDGLLAKRLAEESEKVGGLFDWDGQSFESAIDAFRPPYEDIGLSKSNSSNATQPLLDEHAPLQPLAQDEVIPATRLADWNPPETKRRRQILMIAMAGMVTTLIAIGGLIAFLNFQSTQEPIVQKPIVSPELFQPTVVPSEAEVPIVTKPEAIDSKSDVAIATESPMPVPIEPPTPKVEETPPIGATDLQVNSFEKMLPDKTSQINKESENNASDPNNNPVPSNAEIPEAMMRLSQIFDAGSLSLLPDAIANEKPTVGVEMGAEKVDIETLYHPSPVTAPTSDAVQAKSVSSLTTKNPTSFNALLLLLGQLSGGGIGWDIESIRMTGFDVDVPISLSVEKTTIGEILKSICSEQHLVLTIDERGPVRLRPTPEEIINRLPTDWSLDDLAGQDNAIDAWRALLKQLFPAWNDEWQFQGTVLQWSDSAPPLHRASVAAFLDQARIASGLSPKSKLAESATDPRLGLDASQEPLNRLGTRIIEHSVSLPQLLDVAARDVGLKVFFDWDPLYSHGFSHAKAATSLLRGRTWPQIAKWGMDEFSLVTVVDGAERMVLTTLPYQRKIWRTMILRLDAGKTIDSVRESLRPLSPTDDSGRSMLLVSLLPQGGDAINPLIVARICPPNTAQLQIRSIREALGLPALTKK